MGCGVNKENSLVDFFHLFVLIHAAALYVWGQGTDTYGGTYHDRCWLPCSGSALCGCHYSVFTHMPGLKTVIPCTPYDAKGLLISAIRDPDPVIFFEHKLLYGISAEVPEGDYTIPLGVADIKRKGRDATLVAMGRMVHIALEAAEKLLKDGIDLEVIDLRTLSPMDNETILESVKKTHRLVVLDEDNPRCSVACDIIALVSTWAFDELDAPPRMVTAPHTPVPFSGPLEDYYIPSVEKIVSTVKSLVG